MLFNAPEPVLDLHLLVWKSQNRVHEILRQHLPLDIEVQRLKFRLFCCRDVFFAIATRRLAVRSTVVMGDMQAAIGQPVQMGHDDDCQIRRILPTPRPINQPLLIGGERVA